MEFDRDDIFNIETPEAEQGSSSGSTVSEDVRRRLERRRRWKENRRLVIALILILAMVISLLVAANLGWSPSFLRKLFGTEGADSAYEFSFEPHPGNVFASLEDGLVIASEVGLEYICADGSGGFSALYSMSRPAVTVSGSLGAVWDAGAEDVRFFNDEGISATLETGSAVISVELNDSGWSAVCARESGYRGAVTVYDDELAGIYKWYVSSGYLSAAAVSADCSGMCAATYSQSGVDILSRAHFFLLTSEEPLSSFEAEGEVFLDVGAFESGGYFIISDAAFYIFSASGELVSEYDFEERYLISYSAGASNSVCIVLSAYSSGAKCDIINIEDSGRVRAQLNDVEEVRTVSACGDTVAVLSHDRVSVLNSALRESAVTTDITGIRNIISLEDGSVLLIGSDAATFLEQ